MVWGRFSAAGKGKLVFINGIMNEEIIFGDFIGKSKVIGGAIGHQGEVQILQR